MEQFSFGAPKKQPESNFLEYPGHKEDVYEASLNLANYLKDEKISNIMFLDRSGRQAYVGLKEAWKKIGEGEPEPNIYFLNPNELRTNKNFSDFEKEFDRNYTHLNREDPILLYDACVHSGDTLFPTKDFLEHLGFTNVKLAVTSPDKDFPEERHSELDFICLDHRARAACHPFGHPLYISKEDEHIISQKIDSKHQRARARMEHERIKDAFNDQYEKNNS